MGSKRAPARDEPFQGSPKRGQTIKTAGLSGVSVSLVQQVASCGLTSAATTNQKGSSRLGSTELPLTFCEASKTQAPKLCVFFFTSGHRPRYHPKPKKKKAKNHLPQKTPTRPRLGAPAGPGGPSLPKLVVLLRQRGDFGLARRSVPQRDGRCRPFPGVVFGSSSNQKYPPTN